ncbi:UNVERIFIED_CONTAM: hypothetical protein H355_014562 [Colinus virginianus]|nr:hypothetical protein H355_014562 [Colinus virginianus]
MCDLWLLLMTAKGTDQQVADNESVPTCNEESNSVVGVATWNQSYRQVKAGGMRIVQKHPHSSDTKEEKDKDDQDWETSRGSTHLMEENLGSSKQIKEKDDLQIVKDRNQTPRTVKAGGMRIVQKHPHSSDTKEEKDKDDQDWETSRYAVQLIPLIFFSPPKPTVFISGVVARGDKDFPPAAAQVAHQKPHPSVEKLPHPQHIKQHIHQPRK